ncbi:MAG: helix-turn-helix domain-containing protein [Opitutales bacterium]
MPNNLKLIAIAYDLSFRHAAEIFSGAADYIQSRSLDWQLLPLNFGFEAKLMELAKSGRLRGAIGTFVSDAWIRGLHACGVAAVNLFDFSKITSVPTVRLHDEAIGQIAVRHLLEQGAKSLAFIGQDRAHFNQIRRRAMIAACPPEHYLEIDPLAPRRQQALRLSQARQPVGVLCSDDRIARELCNEAKLLDLEIGHDLLIIGIGNEPSESTFAGIGLSSFEIPSREIGFRAARQMDLLLRGEKQICHPPAIDKITAKLLFRESTLASPQARLAERTMAAIRASLAQSDFDIASLSRQMGVSRRSLELATRHQFDKSPYQILSELRLVKAKKMLLETNTTITKIGEICGYPVPHHFSAWFKQRTGMSPKKFRYLLEERS